MDKWHKALGIFLLVAIAVIFLQKCGKDCPELIVDKKEIVSHKTTIDTTWIEMPKYRYFEIPVPKPYYDTTFIYDTIPFLSFMDGDFDDLPDRPLIYEDTIKRDTLSLCYRLEIRGALEKITLGYKLAPTYSIIKTEIIETETTKKIKYSHGFYAGLDIGGNLGEFNHFSPTIEMATRKYNYNLGYNLMNNSVILGVRVRIGKKSAIKLAGI